MNASAIAFEREGRYTISVDGPARRILVRVQGCWNDADSAAYLDQLRSAIAARRSAGQPLTIIVDLTASAVQPPAVAQMLSEAVPAQMVPGDRAVIVVPSSLGRMQVKRLMRNDAFIVVASMERAEQALTA